MSTYMDDVKAKAAQARTQLEADAIMMAARPAWELRNMRLALSLMGALNTPEENYRLKVVKAALRLKGKRG